MRSDGGEEEVGGARSGEQGGDKRPEGVMAPGDVTDTQEGGMSDGGSRVTAGGAGGGAIHESGKRGEESNGGATSGGALPALPPPPLSRRTDVRWCPEERDRAGACGCRGADGEGIGRVGGRDCAGDKAGGHRGGDGYG